jgi:hypothetical protein
MKEGVSLSSLFRISMSVLLRTHGDVSHSWRNQSPFAYVRKCGPNPVFKPLELRTPRLWGLACIRQRLSHCLDGMTVMPCRDGRWWIHGPRVLSHAPMTTLETQQDWRADNWATGGSMCKFVGHYLWCKLCYSPDVAESDVQKAD